MSIKGLLMMGASAMLLSTPAIAQEQQDETEVTETRTLNAITVTARKREESLLETPVSVSAVDSSAIEARGLVAISDLADATPAFSVSDSGAGKVDRTVQTFTLRGFSPNNATDPTVSMFIDSVPVSSTTALSSIGSPERVEILRGPQSAYFGRNTFAGAVNVVNKKPGDEWGGSVEVTLGNNDYQRYRGEIEGPIIADKLFGRVSGEFYDKTGDYNSALTGDSLGDQRSSLVNGFLMATPTEGLTIKAFGLYAHDDDGPTAAGFISAYDVPGSTLTDQSNCIVNGNPYFCGEYPQKADPISFNTRLLPGMEDLLNNSENRLNDDLLDGYGMEKVYEHYHLTADWDIADTGFTISSLTGYNKEDWATLVDLDYYGSDSFNYAFFVQSQRSDWSQEFRLAYDQGGKFRGTMGVSYLESEYLNSNSGGLIDFGAFYFGAGAVSPANFRGAKNAGIFFGASYDVTEKMTVSAEGRYQEDEIWAEDSSGAEQARDTFGNFIPRLIVDYDITDDSMVYVSYSEGVNPGNFNITLLDATDSLQAAAAAAGVTLVVDPETTTNYEIGYKGRALNDTMSFQAAAFVAKWEDQLNRVNIVDSTDGNFTSISGLANAGAVDIWGLETEINWLATDNLTVNMAGSYTNTEIVDHQNNGLTLLTGISDFSGKEQPFVSKYQGNIGVQYDGTIAAKDWFARADYIYKSGQYANQANVGKTGDVHRVNLRTGITIENVQLSAYVKNVFESEEYTNAYDFYAFTADFALAGVNSGVILGLPEKRQIGVSLKASF